MAQRAAQFGVLKHAVGPGHRQSARWPGFDGKQPKYGVSSGSGRYRRSRSFSLHSGHSSLQNKSRFSTRGIPPQFTVEALSTGSQHAKCLKRRLSNKFQMNCDTIANSICESVDQSAFKSDTADLTEHDNITNSVIKHIWILHISFIVQIIAVVANMIMLWRPEKPAFNSHWGTQTCKAILTLVTIIDVYIVWRVRTIEADYNWKHHKLRSDSGVWLSGELFLLSVHTPPFIDWAFALPGWWDTCNVFTFYRFYLLSEMLKINHPCWLRRGELVNVLRNSAGETVAINTTYVARVVLLQAPFRFWGTMFSCVLIVFTYWLFIMEQTATVYRPVWIWLYYTLTCFTGVGLGDVLVVTNFGRMITVMLSMFGVAATAVFVSSLMSGVRMAENEIAAANVCDYLETTKRIKECAAITIQTWWRDCMAELKGDTNMEMSIKLKPLHQKGSWRKYAEWEDPLRTSANRLRKGFQKLAKRRGLGKVIGDMPPDNKVRLRRKFTEELESNEQQLSKKLEVLMSPSRRSSRSHSNKGRLAAEEFIRRISMRRSSATMVAPYDNGEEQSLRNTRLEDKICAIDKNLKNLKTMLTQLTQEKARYKDNLTHLTDEKTRDKNNALRIKNQIFKDEMERRLASLSSYTRPSSPPHKHTPRTSSGH